MCACAVSFVTFGLADYGADIQFPLVVLTASGGHNDIYVVFPDTPDLILPDVIPYGGEWNSFGGYHIAKVGYSLDDAAGECFDKVARML